MFSCASTRVSHLELTPDLTGDGFIRVMKRLMGRKGIPLFGDRKVKLYVTTRNIVWRYNLPYSSWWGGFFEISVKLTKCCLRKLLRNAQLTYEESETVFIEIESVLDSSPLTYV